MKPNAFKIIQAAIQRYHDVVRLCAEYEYAQPHCMEIDWAEAAIGSAVLYAIGASESYYECPLPSPPRPRQKPEPKKRRPGFVYLMRNARNGLCKIGFSENPQYREVTLQSEEPEVSLLFKAQAPLHAEAALHERYKDKRVRGEWFSLTAADVQGIRAGFHAI